MAILQHLSLGIKAHRKTVVMQRNLAYIAGVSLASRSGSASLRPFGRELKTQ
jgi:hypothetical protein